VLHAAARSQGPRDDREILDAAQAARLAPAAALSAMTTGASDARLQFRAFGANPNDAEVAGNLAFLYLKQSPPQAEAARQLALYAATMSDARFPHGRFEDWTTLAVASALMGREQEARNAFFVSLALSPSLERSCRDALNAYASYGNSLRGPAEALLYRIQSWGRSNESPYCNWPPRWSAATRFP